MSEKRVTVFERRLIAAVRKEFDAEYTAADTTPAASQRAHSATEMSSSLRA